MTKPNWYVVFTKSQCEMKVANFLTRKHIKNFCPLHKVEKRFPGSKRIIIEPLFPSNVFVYIYEYQRQAVLNIPNVINFLYWLNTIAAIDEEEIISLAKLLKDHHKGKLEKHIIPKNSAGTNEESGYGNTEAPSSDNRVKVLLPSLGVLIIAEPF